MEKSSGLLAGLGALGQLHEVNGLWFNQKKILLDGYRFVGCRFDLCTLHITTTSFELVDCYIDDRTIISYGSDTLKIVKLYNSRNVNAYSLAGSFAPDRNADGTISIRGR